MDDLTELGGGQGGWFCIYQSRTNLICLWTPFLNLRVRVQVEVREHQVKVTPPPPSTGYL